MREPTDANVIPQLTVSPEFHTSKPFDCSSCRLGGLTGSEWVPALSLSALVRGTAYSTERPTIADIHLDQERFGSKTGRLQCKDCYNGELPGGLCCDREQAREKQSLMCMCTAEEARRNNASGRGNAQATRKSVMVLTRQFPPLRSCNAALLLCDLL